MILNLLFASLFIFTVSFLVLKVYFSARFAISILLLKISLPVGYFLISPNKWTPYDGRTFQITATELINMGFTPLSLLFHWEFLINYTSSRHPVPFWWNVLAQYLFGPYYFSPVFLNVLLTIFIGLYAVFILSRAGFSDTYYSYFFVFFLLHWDVLIWSSLINVKGILITLLIIAYLFHFLMITEGSAQKHFYLHVTAALFALFVLYWSRFYIVAILAVTSGLWVFIGAGSSRRRSFAILTLPFLYVFVNYGLKIAASNGYLTDQTLYNSFLGLPKILLTPRPWGVNTNFSFLVLPSVLHWIFFIPSVLYSVRLCYHNRSMLIFFLYTISFVSFFLVFPDLIYARMRIQLVFVFAIIQFHFLWGIIQRIDVTAGGQLPKLS